MAIEEDNLLEDWELLLHVAECLAVLGRRPDAGNLYPALVRGLERGGVHQPHFVTPLADGRAGIAAACGQQ